MVIIPSITSRHRPDMTLQCVESDVKQYKKKLLGCFLAGITTLSCSFLYIIFKNYSLESLQNIVHNIMSNTWNIGKWVQVEPKIVERKRAKYYKTFFDIAKSDHYNVGTTSVYIAIKVVLCGYMLNKALLTNP